MNRIYTLFLGVALMAFVSSCEKCSTCTSISDDPQTEGETLTSEVCGKGRDYNDQIEIYTRSGWDCATEE